MIVNFHCVCARFCLSLAKQFDSATHSLTNKKRRLTRTSNTPNSNHNWDRVQIICRGIDTMVKCLQSLTLHSSSPGTTASTELLQSVLHGSCKDTCDLFEYCLESGLTQQRGDQYSEEAVAVAVECSEVIARCYCGIVVAIVNMGNFVSQLTVRAFTLKCMIVSVSVLHSLLFG